MKYKVLGILTLILLTALIGLYFAIPGWWAFNHPWVHNPDSNALDGGMSALECVFWQAMLTIVVLFLGQCLWSGFIESWITGRESRDNEKRLVKEKADAKKKAADDRLLKEEGLL